MNGVRAKLAAMREDLAAAEKREEIARLRTRDARERTARAEDEIASEKRKIKLVQQNLDRVEEQTDIKLDRLERLNKHIHENETWRRQLERKEMKEDNTLVHLESRQKSRRGYVEEAEQRYREAYNKMRMLEARNSKVDARIRAGKLNVKYFERRLNDAGQTAFSLARSSETKQVKCDEYQERYRRLSEKKERVLITAECLERKAAQLEKKAVVLREEKREEMKRVQGVKYELGCILNELNRRY
ncbi:tropomyosin alpha-3 chain-like [Dendronephthya gigantea]|uniref:tropomyosin alpha-3 chain-like n=1 Tax=Dendronephthya gigantea TaxID=151771 RepID=UPI00106AA6CB|nr:tropomyosin alpha-3 chain-like [Dendronephthya gigantea]